MKSGPVRRRRHHNNSGHRQLKTGSHENTLKRLAAKLRVPYGSKPTLPPKEAQ